MFNASLFLLLGEDCGPAVRGFCAGRLAGGQDRHRSSRRHAAKDLRRGAAPDFGEDDFGEVKQGIRAQAEADHMGFSLITWIVDETATDSRC